MRPEYSILGLFKLILIDTFLKFPDHGAFKEVPFLWVIAIAHGEKAVPRARWVLVAARLFTLNMVIYGDDESRGGEKSIYLKP